MPEDGNNPVPPRNYSYSGISPLLPRASDLILVSGCRSIDEGMVLVAPFAKLAIADAPLDVAHREHGDPSCGVAQSKIKRR